MSGTAELGATFEASDGARRDLATVVTALRSPGAYPGGERVAEAIETHMSWVFLTDTHAYKLKKPIRTAHLDHTTERLRHRACEVELELNRRLAPSVYLDVLPVTNDKGQIRVGGTGSAIDWLVAMRRLPGTRMLDACIARGEIDRHSLVRLGRILAGFYARSAREPLHGARYCARLADDIEQKGASLAAPRYELCAARIGGLVEAQHQWIARHAELLHARAAMIVEAHGDMRPEHICLEPTPVIIDCLEFDRGLRMLDPGSELAFLGLECERLGGPQGGLWVLEGYAEHSGDLPPPHLQAFYRSYHALIRATVAIWHLDDHAIDGSDVWRTRALEYVALGEAALA